MEATTVEDVKKWWERYIQQIREGKHSLHHGLPDLSAPCQIELFWIAEPIEGQAILVTHDRDRSDQNIIVNGPYNGDEFIKEVAAVSKEERWQKPIPPQDYRTPPGQNPDRSDVLASIIASLIGRLEQSIFTDFSASDLLFLSSRRRWGNSSSHILVGNVVDSDISDGVGDQNATESSNEEYEDSGTDDKINSDSPNQGDKNQETEPAGGGFIYPAVWVDEAPERSFEEKVWGPNARENEIVFRGEVMGNDFLAFKDGLLIVLDDDGNRTLNLLNTFFGIGIFGQYFQWRSLQPREFISGQVGLDGMKSSHAEVSTPSRRNQLLSEDTRPADYERGLIQSEMIEWLLRVTEVVYRASDLRERIILHSQAHTHFLDDEYTASFLLNWNVVEQHIGDILDRNLRDRYDVNRGRRQTIENGLNWFISHRIEVAEITDTIDGEMYDQLDRHRSKRNDVVHEMDTVRLEQAEDLDHLVSELLCREVNVELNSTDVEPVTHRPVPMKPATRQGEYDPVKWGDWDDVAFDN